MLKGVCCECQSGGKDLTKSGLIAAHKFMNTNMWCDGGGTVPQATYKDKGASSAPKAPAVKPDALKGATLADFLAYQKSKDPKGR